MEMRVGKKRISEKTIDRYLFLSGEDDGEELTMEGIGLTREQKIAMVQEKAEILQKREWQRWTPVLCVYRRIKDALNNDLDLLKGMNSRVYNIATEAYSAVNAFGTGFGLTELFL